MKWHIKHIGKQTRCTYTTNIFLNRKICHVAYFSWCDQGCEENYIRKKDSINERNRYKIIFSNMY